MSFMMSHGLVYEFKTYVNSRKKGLRWLLHNYLHRNISIGYIPSFACLFFIALFHIALFGNFSVEILVFWDML